MNQHDELADRYMRLYDELRGPHAVRDWPALGAMLPPAVNERACVWLATLGVKKAGGMVTPTAAGLLYTVEPALDADFLEHVAERGDGSWVANAARACLAAKRADLAATVAEVEPMFAATRDSEVLYRWIAEEYHRYLDNEFFAECDSLRAAA